MRFTVQDFCAIPFGYAISDNLTARFDPLTFRQAFRLWRFARIIATRPDIVCTRPQTGDADYRLRAWCAGLAELNHLAHGTLLPAADSCARAEPDHDGSVQTRRAAANMIGTILIF
ncbi:MAG: hypothetical protein GY717_07920 [Rhodobacteraceae bacterium]|nr:hypothetical protein [Paracoccaceae bacterium]